MNDNVLGQVSHVNKGLVAHLTFVRPHIVVVTDVIGQLTGLHKPARFYHMVSKGFSKGVTVIQMKTYFVILRPFAAAIAHERFFPSVLADVSNQRTGLGEGLAAYIAHTGLLTWKSRRNGSLIPTTNPIHCFFNAMMGDMFRDHLCECARASVELQGH